MLRWLGSIVAVARDEVRFEMRVPDELENGSYANFLTVWHSPHEFTLDFAVTGQGQPDPTEQADVVVPANVVARIKLPLTVAEAVLATLAENVTRYESAAGDPIQKPGDNQPTFPPEDLR
jgi:hypothetical protein